MTSSTCDTYISRGLMTPLIPALLVALHTKLLSYSSNMAPQFHKLVYKPDTQATEEFVMIVDGDAYQKWKNGDTSIPVSQIVDSFTVFHSIQGNQGNLGQASRQQLENVFGSKKEDEVALFMLNKGTLLGKTEMSSRGMDKLRYGQMLDTRGSGTGLRGV